MIVVVFDVVEVVEFIGTGVSSGLIGTGVSNGVIGTGVSMV